MTDFAIQDILDHLVKRIVGVLPVTAAGVTLISPGADPRYIAASNGSALRFEQLQSELGEGPCVAAYHSGEAVSMPDLRADERFPAFAGGARRPGGGVHVPSEPRRPTARGARPVPRRTRSAVRRCDERCADAGRRCRRLPAQCAGADRAAEHVGPVDRGGSPRSVDRPSQPGPDGRSASRMRCSDGGGRTR